MKDDCFKLKANYAPKGDQPVPIQLVPVQLVPVITRSVLTMN